MKVLIQRVSRAAVRVGGETIGKIDRGVVVLLGVERDDTPGEVEFLAGKTAALRIFPDAEGRMNASLLEVGGAALVVSQFTLAASTRKGRRPSYSSAAPPEVAEPMYRKFVDSLEREGVPVATGRFQEMMEVELVNDGPVTILLDPPTDRQAGRA